MAKTFLLELATTESLLVRDQVREAQIPARNGYVRILPGHAALLAELGEGTLSYTAEGRRRSLTVQGGWLEVSNDQVRVLADGAGKEG
jgi:F-type H+-transporting ATPase subunit epsilon